MKLLNKRNIKVLISLLLIVFILWQVDISKTIKVFASINPLIAVLVILGYSAGQVISAYKWQIILNSSGIKCPPKKAIKSYFIGMFVNTFGLGIVGGDFTRALLASTKNKAKSIATVIADRAHGLATLAALALCFSISAFSTFSDSPELKGQLLVILISLLTISILGWVFGPRIALKILPDGKIRRIIEQISKGFPQDPKTIAKITIISIAFHSLQILLHYLMGVGIDKQIPISYLFLTIPIINICTSLPISWQGIGVREFAYIYFLSPNFLNKEECLAFGALWLIATTISGCLGGLILWTNDISLPNKNNMGENTNV